MRWMLWAYGSIIGHVLTLPGRWEKTVIWWIGWKANAGLLRAEVMIALST
jgi:hypothetical protein